MNTVKFFSFVLLYILSHITLVKNYENFMNAFNVGEKNFSKIEYIPSIEHNEKILVKFYLYTQHTIKY